jgi:Transposase IS4
MADLSSSEDDAAAAPGGEEYDPYRPFITRLEYRDGTEAEYSPVHEGEMVQFSPYFRLPGGIDVTIDSLIQTFFPAWLLDEWVVCTNAYAASRLPPKRLKAVEKADILRFVAAIYYMGVVRMPSKVDYWNTGYVRSELNDVWPPHTAGIKIKKTTFMYVWRNFHTEKKAGTLNLPDEEFPEESDDDEDRRHEDGDDNDDDNDHDDEPSAAAATEAGSTPEEENESSEEEDDPPEAPRWYRKIEAFMQQVNRISKKICRHPGHALSIDEMMKRYKGRSNMTHKMKHKPIKEGYKFFALCCSQTGCVFDFIIDGRSDGERSNLIETVVMKLVDSIPMRDSKKYYLAMDNFFTTPRVMVGTRERGVAVLGTARGRGKTFPPSEIRSIKDSRFNSLYLLPDARNFLIARWYDNTDVLLVSTVHRGDECILKMRRRPKVSAGNQRHVDRVWANGAHTVPITIPSMIDDYNHWMGGVDRADQLISYYRPNLRCVRTWMPIFLHCLDIIRVNSFIVCKKANKDLKQKDFLSGWIDALNRMADVVDFQMTRRSVLNAKSPPPPAYSADNKKRRRMSHTAPELPADRLLGPKTDHLVVMGKKQAFCVYCSYLYQRAKIEGVHPDILPNRRKVRRSCLACRIAICDQHFNIFHGWDEHGNGQYNEVVETETEEEEEDELFEGLQETV